MSALLARRGLKVIEGATLSENLINNVPQLSNNGKIIGIVLLAGVGCGLYFYINNYTALGKMTNGITDMIGNFLNPQASVEKTQENIAACNKEGSFLKKASCSVTTGIGGAKGFLGPFSSMIPFF